MFRYEGEENQRATVKSLKVMKPEGGGEEPEGGNEPEIGNEPVGGENQKEVRRCWRHGWCWWCWWCGDGGAVVLAARVVEATGNGLQTRW